jgi:hypothetical protein
MDQDRRKWTHYLYGEDWGDPALYDIVLNLEYMNIPEACSAVSALVRQRCFEFTPEDQAAMDDLALASHVRAELALNEATAHLEVEVESRRGALTIRGKTPAIEDLEQVRRVAEQVPGVQSLNLDGLSSPVRA